MKNMTVTSPLGLTPVIRFRSADCVASIGAGMSRVPATTEPVVRPGYATTSFDGRSAVGGGIDRGGSANAITAHHRASVRTRSDP